MPAVLFRGETINTVDALPPWALVEFGAVASDEVEVTSPKGMRTLFDLFEVLVEPHDWAKFRKTAMRASEDELVDFIKNAATALKSLKPALPESGPQRLEKAPEPLSQMWN